MVRGNGERRVPDGGGGDICFYMIRHSKKSHRPDGGKLGGVGKGRNGAGFAGSLGRGEGQ